MHVSLNIFGGQQVSDTKMLFYLLKMGNVKMPRVFVLLYPDVLGTGSQWKNIT